MLTKKSALLLFAATLSFFAIAGGCTKSSTKAVPGKLSGVVSIAPELAASLKPTDVLYIIVRSQQMGPPTAVKRIEKPNFPLEFVVGPEDAMIPSMAAGFSQGTALTVAARLSRTGNALPAAGDIEGVYKENPAKPGQGGVNVQLSQERK